MTKKLLIDAHQPEETRVVLLNGNRIEEFDYENINFQQIKGNVYLARVTRVEPSLQAAFVEYGGNRQGFLAFSEIHPDYYRIPVEDREALVAKTQKATDDESQQDDAQQSETSANGQKTGALETMGGDDEEGSIAKPSAALLDSYKIQEVITRKQILLIQIVKEERGNKGAALTTYLSLAGRYCVLMPNSNKGGGVSRKITNVVDRKKLKLIVNELDVPKGMAVIVRTAGSKHTKTEIKRDYTYLSKLWNEIRSDTLQSEAPALIHEEGSLVKRTVRDMYTNDIEEITIEGEAAYKAAKAQMKMLVPSHVKRVLKHEEKMHLFQLHNVEPQLDALHQTEVTLKSGGYLVINQTEALVAIDVNSGKATHKRNIEETALKTNMEAAEEVSRQLRLRDLSGLIVIDFIDMEENRNQNSVERRLKDTLRHDKARIQVGSISHFGLLEMSRQRLRPSLGESVSQSCPHCIGTGRLRSVNSSALHILRTVEDEAAKQVGQNIIIHANPEVAIYILNQKRVSLAALESQFSISILIEADTTLLPAEHKFGVEHTEQTEKRQNRQNNQSASRTPPPLQPVNPNDNNGDEEEEEDQAKRRKRGRRSGRRRKKSSPDNISLQTDDTNQNTGGDNHRPDEVEAKEDGEPQKKKRPPRRRRRNSADVTDTPAALSDDSRTNANQASGNDMSESTVPMASQALGNDMGDSTGPMASHASGKDMGESTSPMANQATSKDMGESISPMANQAKVSDAGDDNNNASVSAAKKITKNASEKPRGRIAKAKSVNTDNTEEPASKTAKKTPVKKDNVTAKTPAKAKKSTAKPKTAAPAKIAASPDNLEPQNQAERKPISSIELNIVNVDEVASSASKKKGWWSP